MPTNKLETLLDTLEKLDAARTPGNWWTGYSTIWSLQINESVSSPATSSCTDVEIFSLAKNMRTGNGDIPSKQGSKSAEFAVAAVNSNAKLREIIRVQREALNFMAAWNDGEIVDSHFDNPGDAQAARQAISQVEKILEGVWTIKKK